NMVLAPFVSIGGIRIRWVLETFGWNRISFKWRKSTIFPLSTLFFQETFQVMESFRISYEWLLLYDLKQARSLLNQLFQLCCCLVRSGGIQRSICMLFSQKGHEGLRDGDTICFVQRLSHVANDRINQWQSAHFLSRTGNHQRFHTSHAFFQ